MDSKRTNPQAATRDSRYGATAVFLHWLLAILIAGMATLG